MFMSTITLKSRITNNIIRYQPMKKSHIHLKSPGIILFYFSTQRVASENVSRFVGLQTHLDAWSKMYRK
jgi:hypothetical protein